MMDYILFEIIGKAIDYILFEIIEKATLYLNLEHLDISIDDMSIPSKSQLPLVVCTAIYE